MTCFVKVQNILAIEVSIEITCSVAINYSSF